MNSLLGSLGAISGTSYLGGALQQQRYDRRQMDAQARAAQGLTMRRPPIQATMQLVPPDPVPDEFQKYMLGVIDKVKSLHREAFGSSPTMIELGDFLRERLNPWIDSRIVKALEAYIPEGRIEERFHTIRDKPVDEFPAPVMVETREVNVTQYLIKGLIIREHPEETWIDIPE